MLSFLEGAILLAAIGIGLSTMLLYGWGALPAFRFAIGSARDPAATVSPQITDAPYTFDIQLSGIPSEKAQPQEQAVPTAVEYTAPRVLIYHTHATEAYTMTGQTAYEESTAYRTEDNEKNVVAVGSLLQEALLSYGIVALHDPSDHEPPKLSSAYSRSEIAMKTYRSLYPSIELYIDVHRDAYGSEDGIHDVVKIDGTEVARLMFVVGTGAGATGTGFPEMPDYESNYALAISLTESLTRINADLTRPVRVKTGRYNQHISSACLLVEVGHNANTLEQALSSIPYLARVIADHLNETGAAGVTAPVGGSVWVP